MAMAGGEKLFASGQNYDRAMGRWSRIAGERFLDWLAMPKGLRWLDVGCGTGAFTELVLQRNSPTAISAIDPSENLIAFAKSKPSADRIDYRNGDAMSLPYRNGDFDVATMALVIQYIPDPGKAMREMTRVVRQGGTVAAYVWPEDAEGHPYRALNDAIRTIGVVDYNRPGNQMRSANALVELFASSGLTNIESRTIDFALEFNDFDDFWSSLTPGTYQHLSSSDVDRTKLAVRESLSVGSGGRIPYTARVLAICGRVSGQQ
jgi:ubiquinone/menaquinone biosynthesis C-methylase UbiE